MDYAYWGVLAFYVLFGAVAFLKYRRLREAIRRHRDAEGHDRCWLNDADLYAQLPEGQQLAPPVMPPKCEFLDRCKQYYEEQTTTNGG